MKHLLLILILLFSISGFSKTYDRNFGRDLKLPTQKMLEYNRVAVPAALSTTLILATEAGDTTGATKTVTTFVAQQDVARALIVTPQGTTADVKEGNVVITGTNIKGESISENFAFLDNASGATTGAKAFLTVTSIVFPIEDAPFGATWDVGTTDKLGLNKCVAQAGDVAWTVFGGTLEATNATCVIDVDDMEGNTCDPSSACNGSNVDFYFIQNYRCF